MPRATAAAPLPPKDDNYKNLTLADLVEMAIADLKDLEKRAETPLNTKVPSTLPSEDVAKDAITVSKQATLIAADFETKLKDLLAPLVAAQEQIREAVKITTDALTKKKAASNKALGDYLEANNLKNLRNDLGYLVTRRAAKLEVEITDPFSVPLEYMAPDEKAIKVAIEQASDDAVLALGLPPEKDRTPAHARAVNEAIEKARETTVPGARVVLGTPSVVVS